MASKQSSASTAQITGVYLTGPARLLRNVALSVISFVWLVPTLGVFISSIRPRAAVATTGWWTVFTRLDFGFRIQNYHEVITTHAFGRYFVNSFIITLPSTLLPIAVASLGAYAFGCLSFRGRNLTFLALIALMVVPLQVAWVPVLQVYVILGLANTYPGLWLAHTSFVLAFATFMFRNFFAAIPKDFFDCARIEGAGDLAIYARIVMPISIPVVASFFIFQFMWVWNELMNALIFLQHPSKYPLTVAIRGLLSQYGSEWYLLAAGSFVLMSMPLLVFFLFQRFFTYGITTGATKG